MHCRTERVVAIQMTYGGDDDPSAANPPAQIIWPRRLAGISCSKHIPRFVRKAYEPATRGRNKLDPKVRPMFGAGRVRSRRWYEQAIFANLIEGRV
jgi:hypothetical protein